MGLSTTALSLTALSILYLIFRDVNVLTGFSFGASSIALVRMSSVLFVHYRLCFPVHTQ